MTPFKQKFQDAYLQLLHQHSPSTISVKQIVEMANTSRSTFYAHFDSREQLHTYVTAQIEQQFYKHYEQDTKNEFGTTTTLALCQHIIKYRSFYKHVFQNSEQFQHMAIQLSRLLAPLYHDKDYAIFAAFGTMGYLQYWVSTDFESSPSEASEKLLKIGFTNWAAKLTF